MSQEVCKCLTCRQSITDIHKATFVWLEKARWGKIVEWSGFGAVHDWCITPLEYQEHGIGVRLHRLPLSYALHPQMIKTFSAFPGFEKYRDEFTRMVEQFGSEDESGEEYI